MIYEYLYDIKRYKGNLKRSNNKQQSEMLVLGTRNAPDLHPCLEDCSHVPSHRLAQHLPVGHLGDRTLLPGTLEDQLPYAGIHFLDDGWWCDWACSACFVETWALWTHVM